MDFNLLRVFVAVKEAGGFTDAARKLGMPRSSVSRAISSLEREVGERLFQRTTRKVSVSSAGTALYARISPQLRALESALRSVHYAQGPSGVLRVTTTADIGRTLLAETAARYITRYPEASVEVHLSNTVRDLVGEGFDLALRVSTRRLSDSSLVARRIGDVQVQLVASPDYLRARSAPRSVSELSRHQLVAYRGFAPPGLGKLSPRITSDNMVFLCDALRAGAGIGAIPSFIAARDIANGTLVRVLPRWSFENGHVYLLQPSRSPVKVPAFCEILDELLRERPLYP